MPSARASSETRSQINRKELRCSICFDILCFPVTLPCGHNFDRGCILTAWKYSQPTTAEPPSTAAVAHEPMLFFGDTTAGDADEAQHSENPQSLSRRRAHHVCPLCRQETGIGDIEELQVNILLKNLIAHLYPLETHSAATLEKQQWTRKAPTSSVQATNNTSASTRFSFRAVSSFVYVCVASVTDPPGFVLAVLLLMGLIAIAFNPQHALANNAAAALTLLDILEHVFNGFALLIREFSLTLDQLDQLKPWLHAFSFIF
uniref:RING-type domain-containing protein n=1 Tax=Globisporangium ultimum (strain ATCC 200006 / CBS 805.95 / DAOM BR144) TaxID=431595 RepID=K3W7Q9_GLOUD